MMMYVVRCPLCGVCSPCILIKQKPIIEKAEFKTLWVICSINERSGRVLGVIVNVATVLIGSAIGLIFKKSISKRISDAVMVAIGACTLFIGSKGSLDGNNVLITIIAMVLGVVAGTLVDIDKQINKLGDFFKSKFSKTGSTFTEGFVTGCLIFCVGAMTITGSIDSGITGDNSTIFAKSLLDLISSMMLASALGIGVMFASVFCFAVPRTACFTCAVYRSVSW